MYRPWLVKKCLDASVFHASTVLSIYRTYIIIEHTLRTLVNEGRILLNNRMRYTLMCINCKL